MTAGEQSLRWSELRQAEIPHFELRLYEERAGLGLPEALRWWEQHVLSGEAARAIAAGWTLEDVVRARAASLSVDDAIRYAERSGVSLSDVGRWHREGVLAEEAAEAVAAGWSLEETIERHPRVAERRCRLVDEQLAAIERIERDDAVQMHRAQEARRAEELERERRDRRARARNLLELSGRADGTEVRFRVDELDGAYWAIGLDGRRRGDLGEFDDLAEALVEITRTTLSDEGVLGRARLTNLDLTEFVAVSDRLARVADRQFLVEVGHSYSARIDEDDIYDDDHDEDAGFDKGRTRRWSRDGDHAFVMRTFESGVGMDLVPAVPVTWPGCVRHTEQIVSVGDVYMHVEPDDFGSIAALVGRFPDRGDGLRAARDLGGSSE